MFISVDVSGTQNKTPFPTAFRQWTGIGGFQWQAYDSNLGAPSTNRWRIYSSTANDVLDMYYTLGSANGAHAWHYDTNGVGTFFQTNVFAGGQFTGLLSANAATVTNTVVVGDAVVSPSITYKKPTAGTMIERLA